ncbi:hypothetical protein [Streptomyces sp. NPDC005865]|uniref:hypothetical protein n=1 Tax=Streptomyces sp. NPDC005865 TaxID=3155453 RepID=UPI0034049B27
MRSRTAARASVAQATAFSVMGALLAVASYHFVVGPTPSWDVRAVAATILCCAALSRGAAARSDSAVRSGAAARRDSAVRSGAALRSDSAVPPPGSSPAPRSARRPCVTLAGRVAARRWTRRVVLAGRPATQAPAHQPPDGLRRLLSHATGLTRHDAALRSHRALRRTRDSLSRILRMLRLLCVLLARVLRPVGPPRAVPLPRPVPAPRPGRPARAISPSLLLADAVVRRGPPARPPLTV